jgi:homoserine O-acetyltransferase
MDTFDLSRGYETEGEALGRVRASLLLVGISSDWLFPAEDVRALTERARAAGADAVYVELQSAHGHDGFLADADALVPLINEHMDRKPARLRAGCAS